jgi:hypothetical protein
VVGGVLVLASLVACGGRVPAHATTAPPLAGGRPTEAPITLLDTPFAGALPRSADFVGLRFTIESARISNLHPYPIFSHDPGRDVFGILSVKVENISDAVVDYIFDEDAFALRTWSGGLLPEVQYPGVHRFARLAAGESATDTIAFGLPEPDLLDGGQLLIGAPPDAPAVIALTGSEQPVAYPVDLTPAQGTPAHAGPIDWRVTSGLASLDRPEDVPSSASGDRANEAEVFVVLTIRATVSGSQYRQASVTSEGVRLVVDGTAIEPLQFRGQANVPEGQSLDFTLGWVVPRPFETIAVQFTSSDGTTGTIELRYGEAGA